MKLPVSMFEQLWDWGMYTREEMQLLVSYNAFTIEDYERITDSNYPPLEHELQYTSETTL